VIGGVAIFGGSGTVWGAAIGAVLLVTINRALPTGGIPGLLAAGPGRRADPQARSSSTACSPTGGPGA
jgi:ABC-type branched-subunit amino acid transport system permease subunit